jgi:hypothetical protein
MEKKTIKGGNIPDQFATDYGEKASFNAINGHRTNKGLLDDAVVKRQ